MIDLHCHSTYSNGELTPLQLLEKAQEKRIKYFSITDHNEVGAHNELSKINVKKYYDGELLTGCEFICMFNGIRVDILGYKFKLEPIKEWLDNWYRSDFFRKNSQKQFDELYQKCKDNNLTIDPNLIYDINSDFPMNFIYNEIVKYPENKKIIGPDAYDKSSYFYRYCTSNKSFILYCDFSKCVPSLEEVSKIVRSNGGLLFFAHPFGYKLENYFSFFDELTNSKLIDGFECYHSIYLDEKKDILVNYCNKNNLLISAGSDFHKFDKNHDLGIKVENINKFDWI